MVDRNSNSNGLFGFVPLNRNASPSSSLSPSSSVSTLVPPVTASCAVGCIAFGCTVAASTLFQLRVLKVSTGTCAPIPTILGLLTVSLASLASGNVGLTTYHVLSRWPPVRHNDLYERMSSDSDPFGSASHAAATSHLRRGYNWKQARDRMNEWKQTYNEVWNRQERWKLPLGFGTVDMYVNQLRICCYGLVAFKVLGGRFWSISPSSYTSRGSFARSSVMADGTAYASRLVRQQIDILGRRYGCHTCGSRRSFILPSSLIGTTKVVTRFHADHVPSNAIARRMNARWYRKTLKWNVRQKFYPQCTVCSNTQGGMLSGVDSRALSLGKSSTVSLLRKAGGGNAARFHGLRFRISHLAGAVTAGVAVHELLQAEIRERQNAFLVKIQRGEKRLSDAMYHFFGKGRS